MNSNTGKVVTAESCYTYWTWILWIRIWFTVSQPDGTFVFSNVPFDANTQFAVMATFNGVTYFRTQCLQR
jgi:hypothetical protein